ncbi:oligoendopeptidase F [Olsenella sp. Marseille-P4559]|uniref:oligoendopeptidase F n=1 Tax=Olsenella sp. Marseille-P4559 TaxID=2364795 RepID=UPI001032659E|nr:oligoendopeptidase F [Olsenella sp. Marseille-P4559]
MQYQSRDQIPERYRWDLSSMCKDDKDFERQLEGAKAFPAKLAAYRGRVSASAEDLLAYLRLVDESSVTLDRLGNYADRQADVDTRVAKYQVYSDQVMGLEVETEEACSWFSAELLGMADEKLAAFFAEEPGLEHYRRAVERELRMRPHRLSAPEEAILARTGDSAAQPERVFSQLNNADLTFTDATDAQGKKHPVTHGSFINLERSHDRVLRKSAFDSVYASYGAHRNTCAGLLAAQVKQLKFFADSRHYKDALEYRLDANEVPTSVYDNLVGAVNENLGALHSYASLRKSVLGVDELHFWDMYVPLVDSVDLTYTYEEAWELILKALEPLGENYLTIVREGLERRWIDVYETPGKRSGAYSSGSYGTNPVILTSFNGSLDDVFTLAHEMGHSVHTYLSCHAQSPTYSDYPIFVAEVASTLNEALLSHYLLEHTADPAAHAYVLNNFVESFRATLYRQCMFAEFERNVNEMNADGRGVTADALCKRWGELNAQYFGDAVVVDDGICLEWARIPHFYYGYYVYQYATSYAAAIAISNRILTEGAPAVEEYLGCLKGGSSKPPIELLRDAGVDMATPKPVEDALAYFSRLIDRLRDEL